MTAPDLDAVIFDVGAVLIDWNPRYLYAKIFLDAAGQPDDARIDWFLDTICTSDWNIEQDKGRPIAEANAELIAKHPDYKAEIEAFYGRFQEMISGPIQGSVDAMAALGARGLPIYGLTNFCGETFPPTTERFAFLRDFVGVVVSGDEKMKKPDPAIFHLITTRYALTPTTTLFIDDSAANIASANELGFQTHHFLGEDGLLADLRGRGLIG